MGAQRSAGEARRGGPRFHCLIANGSISKSRTAVSERVNRSVPPAHPPSCLVPHLGAVRCLPSLSCEMHAQAQVAGNAEARRSLRRRRRTARGERPRAGQGRARERRVRTGGRSETDCFESAWAFVRSLAGSHGPSTHHPPTPLLEARNDCDRELSEGAKYDTRSMDRWSEWYAEDELREGARSPPPPRLAPCGR